MEGPRRAALDTLLSLSDVVLMTEEEASALTGTTQPLEAARWVLQRPGTATQWAVVKAGPDGALLYTRDDGDGDDQTGAFHAAAYKVDVRDTVGCGDSFAAAVVLGYLSNHSIPTVMALANAVGAATAMGIGAGRNVAAVDDVVDLLRSSIDVCVWRGGKGGCCCVRVANNGCEQRLVHVHICMHHTTHAPHNACPTQHMPHTTQTHTTHAPHKKYTSPLSTVTQMSDDDPCVHQQALQLLQNQLSSTSSDTDEAQ